MIQLFAIAKITQTIRVILLLCMITSIGVAPITCNKNSNIQGRSPNVVKLIFHAIRNCS